MVSLSQEQDPISIARANLWKQQEGYLLHPEKLPRAVEGMAVRTIALINNVR